MEERELGYWSDWEQGVVCGGGGTQARDCTAVACHEKEPCSAEREGEGEAEREEKEREER